MQNVLVWPAHLGAKGNCEQKKVLNEVSQMKGYVTKAFTNRLYSTAVQPCKDSSTMRAAIIKLENCLMRVSWVALLSWFGLLELFLTCRIGWPHSFIVANFPGVNIFSVGPFVTLLPISLINVVLSIKNPVFTWLFFWPPSLHLKVKDILFRKKVVNH